MRASWRVVGGVTAIVVMATVAATATGVFERNRVAVRALHELARADAFGPSSGWNDISAYAVMDAARLRLNLMDRLVEDAGERGPLEVPSSVNRNAVALYRYGQAVAASREGERASAVAAFRGALIARPYGWSTEFYASYGAVLSHGQPSAFDELDADRVPEPTPQVVIDGASQANGARGDRDSLRGVTIHSHGEEHALLPVVVDWWWGSSSVDRTRQTVENILPNGELVPGPGDAPAGWTADVPVRPAVCGADGQTSGCVEISGGRLDGAPGIDSGAIVLPRARREFLFVVRMDVEPAGNPHAFVAWLDASRRVLRSDLAVQGASSGQRVYRARVLAPPAGASYVQVGLVNWHASGAVRFDGAWVLPVPRAK